MPKRPQENNITLYIQCRKEHSELVLSVMRSLQAPKGTKPRITNLSKIRFYGSVFKPENFKYRSATVYVSPHRGMEVDGEADDMGWARTQDRNILLYVFWPDALFQPLNVLASSGRITTIRASISPLQRGNATVRSLDFDTQPQGERDSEFEYWFISKPRKKKEE